MKVAIIPNLAVLEYDAGDIHMMLPEPYMREQRYRDYYNSCYGYKILDNGEAEGLRMRPRELMEMAIKLGADEVVVPDHLGDSDKTIELCREFALTARKYPGFKYMAVLQGQNHQEYLACLRAFASYGYITTIGVPRNICKVLGSKWARVALLEMIMDLDTDGTFREFKYHALGATSWMREAAALSEIPIMRSVDTSLPVVLGLEGADMRKAKYIDRQTDFFERIPDHHQREMILDNISAYRDWAGDYPETPVGAM